MDKKFIYSSVAFLTLTGIPIGGFMLSVATYPGADITAYMIDNFNYILMSAFGVTVSMIGIVFYIFADE